MGVELLTDRYQSQIAGMLSCYDRIIIQGTVPPWGYASVMTEYFDAHQIRILDYPRWAQPLRDVIREHAERRAEQNQIEIEFIRSRKKGRRKEDRVQEIPQQRGEEPSWYAFCRRWNPAAATSRGIACCVRDCACLFFCCWRSSVPHRNR